MLHYETNYIEIFEQHPGGHELITEWAGKDGTKAFDDFGHSGDAKKDMKRYKIGEVTPVSIDLSVFTFRFSM